MLAVIRLRGSIKMNRKIDDTLKLLHLDRVNTMIITERIDSKIGMIKKAEDFVAWGEISNELLDDIKNKFGDKKVFRLKPPKGGLKSIKKKFPKGDLGYHGNKINDLIIRML